MRIVKYLIGGWLLLGLMSCHLNDVSPSTIDEEITDYQGDFNQSYGSDPSQRYDIYYPYSTSQQPSEVLILLHGGAWGAGDKSFLLPTVRALMSQKKNLTIVNANYRLTSSKGIRLEQQLNDIKLLINHLHQKATNFNITTGAFAIGGVSAGGHLALEYAYARDTTRQIKGVVGIVAPTDLSSEPLRKTGLDLSIQQLLGTTFEQNPDTYYKASPFYTAKSTAPTTLLFYGGKDAVVPREQGELLKFKLTTMGVKHRYYFYPDETHDFTAELLADKIIALFAM